MSYLRRASLSLYEFAGVGLRARIPPSNLSWCLLKQLRHATDSAENASAKDKKSGLLLSDTCVQRLQQITRGDGDEGKEKMLRVVVESGGCSGFQYKFELDTLVHPDDKIYEKGGVKIVVDELSLSFIEGSTIDYYRELIRSSFRILDNPNASLGCSCGVSFSLK